MSDELLRQLYSLSPQVAFLIVFLIALGALVREYKSLRGEIKASVDDAVDARLGSALGQLQIERHKASEILEKIVKQYEEAQDFSVAFEGRLTERETEINKTLARLEDRLSMLGQAVRTEEAIKHSAKDLGVLAGNTRTLGEALQLIEEARKDPDATSRDLEIVGDVARRFGRWSLARILYTEAVSRDPSNRSAQIELLTVTAENCPEDRERSLEEARNLVLATLDDSILGRTANAYYHLDRYADVRSLCEEVISRAEPESDAASQAHRDLAVTLRHEGRPDEARKLIRVALDRRPDDENLLKAYIGLLRERRQYPAIVPIAQRLLTLDPLDPDYYSILGRAYSDVGDYDNAIVWFDRGVELPRTTAERELALRERKGAELRRSFNFGVPGEASPLDDSDHYVDEHPGRTSAGS